MDDQPSNANENERKELVKIDARIVELHQIAEKMESVAQRLSEDRDETETKIVEKANEYRAQIDDIERICRDELRVKYEELSGEINGHVERILANKARLVEARQECDDTIRRIGSNERGNQVMDRARQALEEVSDGFFGRDIRLGFAFDIFDEFCQRNEQYQPLSSCTHSDGVTVSRDGPRWTATNTSGRDGYAEYLCVSGSSCVGRGRGRVWKLTFTRTDIHEFGVFLATVGEHGKRVHEESDVFGWEITNGPGEEWVSGRHRDITSVPGGVSMFSSCCKRGSVTLLLKYDRGVDDRVTLAIKDVDPEDGWVNTMDLSEKGVPMDVLDRLVPCVRFVYQNQSMAIEGVHDGEF